MTQTFPGAAPRRGVLAIDEGTTGTRAGVVLDSGAAHEVLYRPIKVSHPDDLSVEQDPMEIWTATLDVARRAVGRAREDGITVTSVALSTQRATAMLWDRVTGRPLLPAVVWQDRRYAAELTAYETEWDAVLLARQGRPVGARAPFLWAARQIATHPEAAEAHRAGRLLFGTVDTWLIWRLTGGAVHATTPTNAASSGGYLLTEHAWDEEWIGRLGFPLDLLPELRSDDAGFGTTDPAALGIAVPLAASMGDQHAALVALGGLTAGQGMVMYGTGAFVDAATGTVPALPRPDISGVLAQPGRRQGGTSHYSLEAYTSTAGSAMRWLCDDLGLFASPKELGEEAGRVPTRPGRTPRFVPSLAGVRTPVWHPESTAALTGLTLATTRADLARAVLDGIAHSVCDLIDGIADTMGGPFTRLRLGGGVSGSDPLMQIQADLTGLELERVADSATASLRGTAYLAGTAQGLWSSLDEVVEAQPHGRVFRPSVSRAERTAQRAAWRDVLIAHLGDPELRPYGAPGSPPHTPH
ncbi:MULTISPECIES: FGGY family carbohydrate kinase [unclassified Streptomyces]|uniref:FGGY family carbohydrate kinase n=1 Tax=unclassified Streptomyces TaxID=2593676 RepID=UPI000CD4F1FA|nr:MULTISPECIES: FGGY family carbohydrate kinase [unclassified Streptomyces]AWL41470.1 carbohydrate kinase [Streptomyces sp. SM18]